MTTYCLVLQSRHMFAYASPRPASFVFACRCGRTFIRCLKPDCNVMNSPPPLAILRQKQTRVDAKTFAKTDGITALYDLAKRRRRVVSFTKPPAKEGSSWAAHSQDFEKSDFIDLLSIFHSRNHPLGVAAC